MLCEVYPVIDVSKFCNTLMMYKVHEKKFENNQTIDEYFKVLLKDLPSMLQLFTAIETVFKNHKVIN